MMLSRTSLTASRASPRRTVAVSLLRANSTASPIAQQTPSSTNTTAPRRSIPRASAFADLLAPRAPTLNPSKAPTVGLSSLGDDQFDGKGRAKNFSRPQKGGFAKKGGRQNFSLTDPPKTLMADGVLINFDSTPKQRRDNRRPGGDGNGERGRGGDRSGEQGRGGHRNGEREWGGDRNGEKGRGGGRKDVRVWGGDRDGERGRGGDRNGERGRGSKAQTTGKVPAERTQRKADNEGSQSFHSKLPISDKFLKIPPEARANAMVEALSQHMEAARTTRPQRPAPKELRKPRTAAVPFNPALAEAMNAVTRQIENGRSPSQSALVGTPTVLEEQAGHYWRYLEHNVANRGSRSPMLGPVDYAKLTLGKRPDVSLEEKSKAVEIVSAGVGLNNAKTHV